MVPLGTRRITEIILLSCGEENGLLGVTENEKKGGGYGACNFSFWFSGLLAWPDSPCDWS